MSDEANSNSNGSLANNNGNGVASSNGGGEKAGAQTFTNPSFDGDEGPVSADNVKMTFKAPQHDLESAKLKASITGKNSSRKRKFILAAVGIFVILAIIAALIIGLYYGDTKKKEHAGEIAITDLHTSNGTFGMEISENGGTSGNKEEGETHEGNKDENIIKKEDATSLESEPGNVEIVAGVTPDGGETTTMSSTDAVSSSTTTELPLQASVNAVETTRATSTPSTTSATSTTSTTTATSATSTTSTATATTSTTTFTSTTVTNKVPVTVPVASATSEKPRQHCRGDAGVLNKAFVACRNLLSGFTDEQQCGIYPELLNCMVQETDKKSIDCEISDAQGFMETPSYETYFKDKFSFVPGNCRFKGVEVKVTASSASISSFLSTTANPTTVKTSITTSTTAAPVTTTTATTTKVTETTTTAVECGVDFQLINEAFIKCAPLTLTGTTEAEQCIAYPSHVSCMLEAFAEAGHECSTSYLENYLEKENLDTFFQETYSFIPRECKEEKEEAAETKCKATPKEIYDVFADKCYGHIQSVMKEENCVNYVRMVKCIIDGLAAADSPCNSAKIREVFESEDMQEYFKTNYGFAPSTCYS